jgi:hypothetical protein
MLGPKTESHKRVYLQSLASSIFRPHSLNYDGSFSDAEMKFIRTYFQDLLPWKAHYPPDNRLVFETIEAPLKLEKAGLDQNMAWLSFGCTSPCILNALLPLAICQHKYIMSDALESPDNEEMERSRDYRIRSYSHLRSAISKKENLEIFCTCLLLVQCGILHCKLSQIPRRDFVFPLDLLVHFSGLWAALKELYFDPSITDKQWIYYESRLLWNLNGLRMVILNYLRHRTQFPPDLEIIRTSISSILSEIVYWPVRSLTSADVVFQTIQERRLNLALFFVLLDQSSFADPLDRPSLESDYLAHILQSLTNIEMQMVLGIENEVNALVGVGFPPTVVQPKHRESTISYSLARHLTCKIIEVCVGRQGTWGDVMALLSTHHSIRNF